jgi:hypothetical protein
MLHHVVHIVTIVLYKVKQDSINPVLFSDEISRGQIASKDCYEMSVGKGFKANFRNLFVDYLTTLSVSSTMDIR